VLLWWAVYHGYEVMVKFLVETGEVDVNSKDVNGYTPLYWPQRRRHESIVRLLLETGKVEVISKGDTVAAG
jgi:ankyrin repeat protein